MDTFLVEVVAYLMVISIPFAVYMLAMHHLRYKRLLKHQNEIKKSLPNDRRAIDEVYDVTNYGQNDTRFWVLASQKCEV